MIDCPILLLVVMGSVINNLTMRILSQLSVPKRSKLYHLKWSAFLECSGNEIFALA